MITQDQIDKAKVKAHFKGWANSVKMSNMAFQIPDALLDSLNPEFDKYVNEALTKLGLIFINGYWERK